MRHLPPALYFSALCLFVVAMTAQGQQASAPDTKLPAPTIFPAPGTYFNTTALTLNEVPGARIVSIVVTAADGKSTDTYRVTFSGEQ